MTEQAKRYLTPFLSFSLPVPGWDSSTHHPPNGRLTEVTNRNDRGYTITYKNWTQTEIDESPDRQWQVDKLTDALNQDYTFTYHAQQQSGMWSISKIDLPTGGDIDYQYAGGFLSQIDYEDGTSSTITYSAGSNGTVVMDVVDLAADPRHRRKEVTFSGSVSTINGTIVPTAVGITRIVVNGEDEVSFLSLIHI